MIKLSPAIAEFKTLHGIDAQTPLLNEALRKIENCCEETQQKALTAIEENIDHTIACEKYLNGDNACEESNGIEKGLNEILINSMTKEEVKSVLKLVA